MSLFKKINYEDLKGFKEQNSYLSFVEREKPERFDLFFKELIAEPLNVNQEVFKATILEDIKDKLDSIISKKIKNNFLYNLWLKDMEHICKIFCDILNEGSISFSLETSRSCKRYHIDNVPMRLLVTYFGKGTEWFPSHACNYTAYYEGRPNEEIIKNLKEKRNLKPWDIAIFKGQKSEGGDKAILHRTPNEALNTRSLLMRLDSSKYLSDIQAPIIKNKNNYF